MTYRHVTRCIPLGQQKSKFEVMVAEGFIRREDLRLFSYAESAAAAWAILEKQGLRDRGE